MVLVKRDWLPTELKQQLDRYNPHSRLGQVIRDAIYTYKLPAGVVEDLLDSLRSCVVMESSLGLTIMYASGRVEPLGIVGRKVVTDVGVGYIVDAFQNSVELENQKFHGLGTGSTAENQTDTALVTELTTEYTGNVRATGTTAEGASANIYSTVATNTLDGTPGAALREHGVFSASSAGVLLDRTVYAAITLSSGDALQSTYQLTFAANG